jgi:hypothetical protein
MPETTKRRRRSSTTAEPQPQSQQQSTHTRIELRWPTDAREVEDLAKLAGQIKANPGRRGEAGMYVIHLWSRVLHGELSPSAFWEMFGVVLPAPTPPMYPMMAMSGMYPGMVPGIAPPQGYEASNVSSVAEDPEAEARKRRRSENRKAQADQWSS